jgi:Transposase zinc-ribbon domain
MVAMDILQRDDLAFPQSLPEFQQLFPNDAVCKAYLERACWPDGFTCRYCAAVGDPFRIVARPGTVRALSSDSMVLPQMGIGALLVHGIDGIVDGSVEMIDGGKGLMSEEMALQIAPRMLDVIEFRCIFGQPFRSQPSRPGRHCLA